MVRIKGGSLLLAAALGFSAPGDVAGRDGPRSPNWDSTLARQSAEVPESWARTEGLFALLRSQEMARLDVQLDSIISGGALSQPVRDAVLFHFAVGLADFDFVDESIVDRLRAVEPRVLVPHEERAAVGVPLFNIAGAAEGVYQLGLRREARAQAQQMLNGPPDEWVAAYLRAAGAQRLGFAGALDGADPATLAGVLGAALRQLPSQAELTPITGKAALLMGDASALEEVLRLGGGSELPRILEAAGLTLPPEEALALLQSAIAEAPSGNAALAIAQLYPRLADRPEASALLFDSLADDALGAAAALALAGAGDGEVRARLREAAEDDGPAAARARSALDTVAQGEIRQP